jgi:hypothetical protein
MFLILMIGTYVEVAEQAGTRCQKWWVRQMNVKSHPTT